MPWVDSSSVLSDESVLTQWSVSTQRSMLSVGDFPAVKDVSSPNRYTTHSERAFTTLVCYKMLGLRITVLAV